HQGSERAGILGVHRERHPARHRDARSRPRPLSLVRDADPVSVHRRRPPRGDRGRDGDAHGEVDDRAVRGTRLSERPSGRSGLQAAGRGGPSVQNGGSLAGKVPSSASSITSSGTSLSRGSASPWAVAPSPFDPTAGGESELAAILRSSSAATASKMTRSPEPAPPPAATMQGQNVPAAASLAQFRTAPRGRRNWHDVKICIASSSFSGGTASG